jgi:drug/metabolite transporter (DMT)-like permease
MAGYIFVIFGIITSASAQVVLKMSSVAGIWSKSWFAFIFLSALLYLISFGFYFFILKMFPISKIYPFMTVCIILIVTSYGFLAGEPFTVRQLIGLLLGMGSIYFIYSSLKMA